MRYSTFEALLKSDHFSLKEYLKNAYVQKEVLVCN
jgi:hypothetical protein